MGGIWRYGTGRISCHVFLLLQPSLPSPTRALNCCDSLPPRVYQDTRTKAPQETLKLDSRSQLLQAVFVESLPLLAHQAIQMLRCLVENGHHTLQAASRKAQLVHMPTRARARATSMDLTVNVVR